MVRRHNRPDPLKAVHEPRWLTVRNRLSESISTRELPACADLRAVLEAERDRRLAEGWTDGEIPPLCAFCFMERGSERVMLSIEVFAPGKVPVRR